MAEKKSRRNRPSPRSRLLESATKIFTTEGIRVIGIDRILREVERPLLQVAQDDSRLLLDRDADLATSRGAALRTLLWLLERDRAIGMLGVG